MRKVTNAQVLKTLLALREEASISLGENCEIYGPDTKWPFCWVCEMPKQHGRWTYAVCEDILESVTGSSDPYMFEVWPGRNGRAATLKAIDAAIELVKL